MNTTPTVTVLMPVFNEEKTVKEVLQKLCKVKQITEIIVINDGSTDGTEKEIKKVKDNRIKYIAKVNGGKGSAIREGLTRATSEYVLIQDADMEYDPEDIEALLEPVQKQKAEIIYGSRFLGPHMNLLFWHRVGNSFLNLLVNVLYNTTLSDMETCYKLVPTRLLKAINLRSNAFDIEPEITCKLLRAGHKIYEVPISYVGRDHSQGKKITWKDGFSAVGVILRERF